MFKQITEEKRILYEAFLVRIIVLLCVVLLADFLPAYGFIGNTPLYDDYRYEEGAALYAQKAESLIDIDTFREVYESMGDWVGYHLANPFTGVYLWYWIACILVYVTKCRWSLRLLNIIFMTFTVKYVYEITEYTYGKKAAKIAGRAVAFLPYLVIFSCFSYKDCLVAFCTFYIWLYFVKRKHHVLYTRRELYGLILCMCTMLFVRSGLSIILIVTACGYYYLDRLKGKCTPRNMVIMLLAACMIFLLLYKFRNIIIYKYMAYIGGDFSEEKLGGGALVTIRKVHDIWKLPLAFVFAILNPIHVGGAIQSWSDVAGWLNITLCPIAVGASLNFFKRRKPDNLQFWIMMGYYFISVISSILIFRQLFSLLPIPIISFAGYYANSGFFGKELVLVLSSLLAFFVIAVL